MEKEQENVTATTKAAKEVVEKGPKLGLEENGEETKPEVKKDEDPKVKVKTEPTEGNIISKVIGSNKSKVS